MTRSVNYFDHDLTSFVDHATRDRTEELRRDAQERIDRLQAVLQRGSELDLEQALARDEQWLGQRLTELQREKRAANELMAELQMLMQRAEAIPAIEWAKQEHYSFRLEETLQRTEADRDAWQRLADARGKQLDEEASKLASAQRELQDHLKTTRILQGQVKDCRALLEKRDETIGGLRALLATRS